MNRVECKGLLFDMDGTLVDSTEASEVAWKEWANQYGINFQSILDVHHGRRPEETISIVAPHLSNVEHARFHYKSQETNVKGIKPIAGCDQFFNFLPNGSFAVVTSATRPILLHRLKTVGLRGDMQAVTSEDVKRGKPDPEGFLKGASLIEVAPKDCVVFEDAPAGIQAAKAAGMRVIALATTHSRDQLSQANWIIDDYSDMELNVIENNLVLLF